MRSRNGSIDRSGPVIIFLHIGKTAGTSLRRILRRQFPPSEVLVIRKKILRSLFPYTGRPNREQTLDYFANLPDEERERPSLIIAHTIYGLHRFVSRPSNYITLLRDPVALTISQYNYVARTPSHPLHARAASKNVTLDDYVRSGTTLEADNSQTRALSGDIVTPFGGCTEEMLETAKANIERHFPVVGLTERFDESLLLLGRTFGWTNLYYVPQNVTPVHRKEPVPAATRTLIEEQNHFDLELHAWANARFEEAIRGDPAHEENLDRFRRNNRRYQPWGKVSYLPHQIYQRLAQ